ncbi:MAG: acylphosphatase [Candidatus Babeliales bacterium]
MKKYLKIVITGQGKEHAFYELIQKYAHSSLIEGALLNENDGNIVIHACGTTEKLDAFIDKLYQGAPTYKVTDLIAEPLNTQKDYRNAFRIIEN